MSVCMLIVDHISAASVSHIGCVLCLYVRSSLCVQNMYRRASGSMSQGRLSPSHSAEVCQISVPSAAVGAIIGSGGANIKQIIRDSGAFVTVS